MVTWIEMCLQLPRVSREQPINVAHIKLLLIIFNNEGIRTDDILPFFYNEKPTLISRINFLCKKGLILKLPKFNLGGNTNPNYYKTTNAGKQLVKALTEPEKNYEYRVEV